MKCGKYFAIIAISRHEKNNKKKTETEPKPRLGATTVARVINI